MKYAAGAAALATVAALPVGLLSQHRRSRAARGARAQHLLIQSIPGVVVALTLVFFSVRYCLSLYQTSTLLVIAYALLFFPLALVCVRGSGGASAAAAGRDGSLARPPPASSVLAR